MSKSEKNVADRIEKVLEIESGWEKDKVDQGEVKRILIKRWYELVN